MKPVCLITPPSPFLLDERVFVSLGILKVAACLEQVGIKIEMVDLSGIENFIETIGVHASASSAHCYGITATSPQMPAAIRIRDAIREKQPDARIILGGPHITLICAAMKAENKRGYRGRAVIAYEFISEKFDVLVAGDGEDAVMIAIGDNPPKYIDADDPNTPLFMSNERLNESPWPARHLVDLDSYAYTIDSIRATSAVFQLGCPYLCAFCSGRQSPMLRRIRTRTTGNIIAEILHIYERYGLRAAMAYDDELNVNPKMVDLMRGIGALQSRLGVEMRFRGFIKSQLFTEEQAEAMKLAGFRWILIGFESGSPRILDNINKRATREDNTRCMNIARKHGLKVKALMSLGHAGETEQTINDTRDWLLEVKPDDFDATIITTYPGCPYFDAAVPHESESGVWTFTAPKSGDRLHAYEIDFTKDAAFYKGQNIGGYKSFVFTDSLTPERLVSMRDSLEEEVREKLNIPFNAGAPGLRYEASMGMTKLPTNILRTT